MSGGVDSSVAALLLKREGAELVGLSMHLWDHDRDGTGAAAGRCCTLDDLSVARRAAEAIGIPHYVLDLTERFEEAVVRPFVVSYLEGRTPIPCTACNTEVKFKTLLARAEALGCDAVATGHYARVETDAATGENRLLKARDLSRDQSYFLYDLTSEQLSRVRFPLGDLEKTRVREIAREAGLPNWDKPDSQEICFVPNGATPADFIRREAPRLGLDLPAIGGARAGGIFLEGGERVGAHEGTFGYTIGQRRGIGIPSNDPLYALATVPEESRVVVGPAPSLLSNKFSRKRECAHPWRRRVGRARPRARAHPLPPPRTARLADSRGRRPWPPRIRRARSRGRTWPVGRLLRPGPAGSCARRRRHSPRGFPVLTPVFRTFLPFFRLTLDLRVTYAYIASGEVRHGLGQADDRSRGSGQGFDVRGAGRPRRKLRRRRSAGPSSSGISRTGREAGRRSTRLTSATSSCRGSGTGASSDPTTNACRYSCDYCPMRAERDFPRHALEPARLARLFMTAFRRGWCDGLFITSGIPKDAVWAMDRMLELVELLRVTHGYRGYLHVKALAGAQPGQVEKLVRLVDRVSYNLEAPCQRALDEHAPGKELEGGLAILTVARNAATAVREARRASARKAPSAVPSPPARTPGGMGAGATTQFVVGLGPETDRDLLGFAEGLEKKKLIHHAQFAAFRPIRGTRSRAVRNPRSARASALRSGPSPEAVRLPRGRASVRRGRPPAARPGSEARVGAAPSGALPGRDHDGDTGGSPARAWVRAPRRGTDPARARQGDPPRSCGSEAPRGSCGSRGGLRDPQGAPARHAVVAGLPLFTANRFSFKDL